MNESIPYYQPPLGGPDAAAVEVARAVVARREEAIIEQKRETLLICTSQHATGKGCGQSQKVRDTVYIQSHWYVQPYGCTGGAYWKQGEGRFRCNTCGHVNRLYDSPEIEAMKTFFASVEESYDR